MELPHALSVLQYDVWGRHAIVLLSAGLLYVGFLTHHLGETRRVKHIPTIGRESLLLSYVEAIKFLFDSKKFVANGIAKVIHSQVVKVPGLYNWLIMFSGKDMIEEFRQAPDKIFDPYVPLFEGLQLSFTMGDQIGTNQYHVPIVRSQMKRATPNLIPRVHEEVKTAFTEYIPTSGQEWTELVAQEVVIKTVCRASNRVFIGDPKVCRDPEYMDININYTLEVITTATILRMFPTSFRPAVSYLLPAVRTRLEQTLKHIGPIIRHRREQIELLGDEYERPVDFLTWLIEEAKGEEAEERAIARRVLVLNFAAIHTSTMSFLQTLYDLALHPEYQGALREEVDAATKEHGWTKDAIDKMLKIDSFIKESQRMRPVSTILANRIAVQDFTFNNGTFIPKGTILGIDLTKAHAEYDNADEFDPWRFYNLQQQTGKRSDITTITPEFLAFGVGRHACPGRFFAAYELKVLLAYLVSSYDMKFRDGVRPADVTIGATLAPNPKAKVMFRRRLG